MSLFNMAKERSRRGRNNKRRGSDSEREVCALLNAEFGVTVRRKLGQARDSGNDVDMGPFTIEVKRRARVAGLYDWLRQAEDATPDGYHLPCVFVRADGQPWVVAMKFHDWATLARGELCATHSDSPSASGQLSSDSSSDSPAIGAQEPH